MYSMMDCKPEAVGQGSCNECYTSMLRGQQQTLHFSAIHPLSEIRNPCKTTHYYSTQKSDIGTVVHVNSR